MTSITSLLSRGVHQFKAIAYKPYQWYLKNQDEKIVRIFIHQLCDSELALPTETLIAEAETRLQQTPNATLRNEIRRHIIAERARLGTPVAAAEKENHDALLFKAKQFKENQHYINNKELSEHENALIEKACENGEFVQLLLDDPIWSYEFFHWILVNDGTDTPYTANDPEIMIKFPGLFKNYIRKFTGRSARFGARLFRVSDNQMLEAKVEGQYRSILKGEEFVTLGYNKQGKKTTTLETIFKEVKGKIYTGNGDFEVIGDQGFTLLNAREGAVYHEDQHKYIRIDLTQEDWLNQLPTIEELDYEQVVERFKVDWEPHDETEQGYKGQYVACPPGSRPIVLLTVTRKGELEFRGTHGFTRFLIPKGINKFELKSAGIFTDWFPQGFWQTFSFMPRFHRARVMIIDENEFNNERSYASWPITPLPTPTQWSGFLTSFKKEIKRGWEGTLEFHTGLRNCTTRVWKKMKHHFGKTSVPSLKVSFWQMKPGDIEGKIMRFIEKFPFFVGYLLMHLLFFSFGSWRTFRAAKKTTVVENGVERTKDKLRTVSMLRSWWKGHDVFGTSRTLIHPAPLFDAVKKRNDEIEAIT